MELFIVCLDRLGEHCKQVRDRLRVTAAKPVVDDFQSGFPNVADLRNLILHPAPIDRRSSRDAISDALTVWAPGGPGRAAQQVINVPADFEYALTIHGRIVDVLNDQLQSTR